MRNVTVPAAFCKALTPTSGTVTPTALSNRPDGDGRSVNVCPSVLYCTANPSVVLLKEENQACDWSSYRFNAFPGAAETVNW